jgi:hypothetical protein
MKPKRQVHAAGLPSLARHSKQRDQKALPLLTGQPSPDYKKWFHGRCFRCLSKDHKVVHCHDPPRCLNYFGSGHLARRCRAPPDPQPLFGRPSQSKPDIHDRLTFLSGSVHSHLMFLELTYVVATPPTDTMAPSNHVVRLPSKRPAQGYVIVVTGGAMSAEAVSQACVATVAYELQRQFHLPHHEPKKFPRSLLTSQKNSLVSFDYPKQCDAVIRAPAHSPSAPPFFKYSRSGFMTLSLVWRGF